MLITVVKFRHRVLRISPKLAGIAFYLKQQCSVVLLFQLQLLTEKFNIPSKCMCLTLEYHEYRMYYTKKNSIKITEETIMISFKYYLVTPICFGKKYGI